ncbi:universal stress protein [Micromonospora sp. CPCC 205371]|nr:universal stress protein [Micromonospora sp. CPCC 205371]
MTELVVVGVDGSPEAEAAVRWAAARLQHTSGRLHLLHAYALPPPAPAMPLTALPTYDVNVEDYGRAGQAVLAAAGELAAGLVGRARVTTQLVPGGAAAALVDASTTADLAVVGSRGRGGFMGLLLGSVSAQLTSHAHCPTIVVRGEAPANGPVVVGVDGSEPSNAAVAFGFAEADRLGARLVAVHAWGAPVPTGPAEAAAMLASSQDRARYAQAARQLLHDALQPGRQRHPGVQVDERPVETAAPGALLDAADDPAMIVVGSRGHGGFAGLLLGSTSQTVLHHATCPVAVIRPEPSGR